MIPILYRNDEVKFTSNGLGRLTDCVSCTVTEERNGIYEVEFQYPITGKFYNEMITNGGIISVIHDDTKTRQPFDIYAHTDPIDGIVTFNAHHISYRLNRCLVKPFTAESAAEAVAMIPQNAITTCPFTFWTDKATIGQFKLDHPANIREILGGSEGSLLDTYGGGDYQFNNFDVRLYTNRGNESDVTIRYGKNLADITNEYDKSETFSAVLPYWTDGEKTVMGDIVRSATLFQDDMPWTDENMVEFEDGRGNIIYFQFPVVEPTVIDFSSDFEEEPTAAQLNARAQSFMTSNRTWLPFQNITVDFVQLWQTPEYESIANLQRVRLCDLVSVYYPEMGIIASSQKVIRVVYNVLLERYDEMELGAAKTSYAETIASTVAEDIQAAIEQQTSYIEQRATELENLVEQQTQMITGGLGGYVVMNLNADGQPQEILIMDTDDIETAVNVIRLNKNGIGFSTTGYSGPYESAWTIDGSFNADFISAGSISANLIQSGTMSANLIRGGILLVGGANNTNGIFRVQDASGTTIVEGNKDGLTVYKGTIRGPTIIAGGDNDEYGMFQLLNADGTVNFQYDRYGMHHTTTDSYGTSGTEITGVEIRSFSESTSAKHRTTIKDGYMYFYGARGTGDSYRYVGALTTNYDGTSYTVALSNYHGSYPAIDPPGVFIGYSSTYSTSSITLRATSTTTSGNFACSGTKSRIVETEEYGKRLLYAYETPSPLFGDVGEAVLDESGTCYVFLDPVFADTIATRNYQVFLQKYGNGDCWISERKPGYFIVQGTAGLAFGWELKAKQSDYDQLRLEKDDAFESAELHDYGNDAAEYFEELMKERNAA